MKIITFLGVADYENVTYAWESRTKETDLFPEALGCWFQGKASEMLVLLTDQARSEKHWSRLQTRLKGKVPLVDQPIPAGRNASELWEIFRILTERLSGGDEVVLDITHALRSLPLLALLSVAFLRTARSVNVRHLLYGAFEARDKQTGLTPVFDLTPFLALLDWITATDQFVRTGNGQALTALLPSDLPVVQALRANLEGLTSGLHLLRPMHVMQQASLLPAMVAAASPLVGQTIPPFRTLLERIEDAYGQFAVSKPSDYRTHARDCLKQQLKMVEWYAEKQQTVHAISLAREWLPSLLCFHFSVDPMDSSERADMELLLRGGQDKEGDTVVKVSPRLAQWPQVPAGKRLRNLWGGTLNLAKLRNDVLHAGFRRNPMDAADVAAKTEIIIRELHAVAVEWQLR